MFVVADGGSGNDVLTGGEEADTFLGGSGADSLTPAPAATSPTAAPTTTSCSHATTLATSSEVVPAMTSPRPTRIQVDQTTEVERHDATPLTRASRREGAPAGGRRADGGAQGPQAHAPASRSPARPPRPADARRPRWCSRPPGRSASGRRRAPRSCSGSGTADLDPGQATVAEGAARARHGRPREEREARGAAPRLQRGRRGEPRGREGGR